MRCFSGSRKSHWASAPQRGHRASCSFRSLALIGSAFNYTERAQTSHFARQPGIVYYPDHFVDILVRLWNLFQYAVAAFAAYQDPLQLQLLLHVACISALLRRRPAHQPARSMADAAKSL